MGRMGSKKNKQKKQNNVISVKQTNHGGMERMKEQMKKQMRSRQWHREAGFVIAL